MLLVGPWSCLELGTGVLYLRAHSLRSCLHAYFDGCLRPGAAVDHGIRDQLGDKQAHVLADATQRAVQRGECRPYPSRRLAPAGNREVHTFRRHIGGVPSACTRKPLNRTRRRSTKSKTSSMRVSSRTLWTGSGPRMSFSDHPSSEPRARARRSDRNPVESMKLTLRRSITTTSGESPASSLMRASKRSAPVMSNSPDSAQDRRGAASFDVQVKAWIRWGPAHRGTVQRLPIR